MGTQNWQKAGHKTKQKAMEHMMTGLSENSACGGLDGKLTLIMGEIHVTITPKDKKEK